MTTESDQNTPASPPIRATFEFNTAQGIQVPESLLPKDADGKPMPAAPTDRFLEQRIESWRAMGVGEDVLQQVRECKPVSEMEVKLAQHKLNSLKGDPAWTKRYLDGGVEERRTMATLSIIVSSPIAEKAEA